MKTLRSLAPIAGIVGLVVLINVVARISATLPILLIGLGLLGGSAWIWWRTRAFLKRAWNADGTVVALRPGRGRARNSSFPVVRFATVTGEEVEFTGGVGTNLVAWPVGQQVTVRYDPHRPVNAKIQSRVQLWFLPGLLALVGGIFTMVGILLAVV
jgi:hypothetical protein